jgi:hypothetical protein
MAGEHFDEQFPLSPADDYMIHQTPDPIRVMWSSDHRTYERFWTVFHDDAGELIVAIGASFYPSLDAAEAYAIVNHRGRHRSVRAFRPLGADRMDLTLGPIRPTIVQGLREWRYELDDNDWGIRFDVVFRDTMRGMFRQRAPAVERGFPAGRRADVTSGFESFGVVDGWVAIDGERVDLRADTCRGTRDRHWGVGRSVGGPKLELPLPRTTVGHSGNSFVAFSDYAIWGDAVLYPFGDARPGTGRIVKTDRRLRFEPDTHIFVEGVIDYTLDSGEVKRVHYERIGVQTAYLRCGMYGGTPESGIHQGEYLGESMVEGDAYDVNDASARTKLMGLDEHQCRVTCDGETVVGIYQPIDPDAYERCAAGLPRWGFLG